MTDQAIQTERSFVPVQPSPQVLRPAVPPTTPLRMLIERMGLGPSGGDHDAIVVTGIEQRSHAVQPGDLFAGLVGTHAHGARFARDAVERGAVAVLTDPAGFELIGPIAVPVLVHDDPRAVLGEVSAAIYGNPSQQLRIAGITGTSGKTTTAYLVEAGLAAAGLSTALIGTIETRIGGRRVPSALTTPEAPQLHAMFALMVEQGVDAVVMEVSSHALALGRVDGVRFAVGAFTNLSQDHLDFHSDFEDYFAAKRRLFEPESPVAARTAVICIDDEWGQRLAAGLADPITVSTGAATGDWHVLGEVSAHGGEQDFTAAGPETNVDVRLRLPGHYNVANGLLAVAVCAAAGVDPAVAAPALANVDVPGRMQRVERGQDFLAIVDYAHKPAAVESVIATLRAHLAADTAARAADLQAAAERNDVEPRESRTSGTAVRATAAERNDAGSREGHQSDTAARTAGAEAAVERNDAGSREGRRSDTAARTAGPEAAAERNHTGPSVRSRSDTGGPGGRLAVVVGAGGDRDAGKRPLMGAAGARGADLLIITDDNPRSEDPAAIRAAIHAGALDVPAAERGEVREIGDRAEAIAAAVDWARPGDAVLVAGKGHEAGQEIHGVKHPFDDREVLATALERRLGGQERSLRSDQAGQERSLRSDQAGQERSPRSDQTMQRDTRNTQQSPQGSDAEDLTIS